MAQTCRYTISEAENIIVVSISTGLLIAVNDDFFITDDPSTNPLIGERKTVEIGDDDTIADIILKIRTQRQ